jgi:hypothetical protein
MLLKNIHSDFYTYSCNFTESTVFGIDTACVNFERCDSVSV